MNTMQAAKERQLEAVTFSTERGARDFHESHFVTSVMGGGKTHKGYTVVSIHAKDCTSSCNVNVCDCEKRFRALPDDAVCGSLNTPARSRQGWSSFYGAFVPKNEGDAPTCSKCE